MQIKETALFALPSGKKFSFSSMTLHFCCFLDKVKICVLVKIQVNTNLDIAAAATAGSPSSSIALNGVAIFQLSEAKLSITGCSSRCHIFQIVLLELTLSLVIRGLLKTVKKLPP